MLIKLLFLLVWSQLALSRVQFLGMNIAGFEFGCLIDGTCPTGTVQPPLQSLGGGDGAGQMQHFVTDDQMNIFRLPVSWQYLTNNKLGGTLNPTNFGKYDQLMQACLRTGAYCVIDLHNFARFNGQIIGQGGPADAQFADIWAQLSKNYGSVSKVVFGLMNEPHDIDVPTWANSVQAAVTAIRNVGATSQMILLPGTNFNSVEFFVSSGSAAALSAVKNPDGSITGLILEVHKYLDIDNSGNHAECTTDNTASFATVATFLRQNGRQAMVTETGAGSTSSCFVDFCTQNTFLNQNSDVFLGYIGWAAGSFSTSYTLSLTPSKQNGKFVDNVMASQCLIGPWINPTNTATFVSGAVVSSTAPVPPPASAAVSITTAPPAPPSTTLRTSSGNEPGSPPSTTSMEFSSTTVTERGGPKTTSSKEGASATGKSGNPPAASSSEPLKASGNGSAARKEVAGGALLGALLVLAL